MDFTCVFDAKGIQLFIFAVIEFPSRRLIIINSTTNPTREWLTQQFRNCCVSGHQFPDAMVHDRDGVYGQWLHLRFRKIRKLNGLVTQFELAAVA